MPTDHQTINPMWIFDVQTDRLGYVAKFKARVVARGDKQRPGINFKDTFSLWHACHVSDVIAVCIIRDIVNNQGDITAAYSNATLDIRQHQEEVEVYLCEDKGMIYIIAKAVYGQRQLGRDRNRR